MAFLPHHRAEAAGQAGARARTDKTAGDAAAPATASSPAHSSLRRVLTAAICLAFVLVPASLAARPHGAAAARTAAAADDPPRDASANALPPAAPAARPGAAAADPPRDASANALPPAVAAILRGSGLPAKSFAFDVRPVDGVDTRSLLTLHADQPFLLASTTKVVTSLAALDLLGSRHRWRTSAYATGPVVGGRLAGDLVIVGGPVGLTGNELRRWFAQMRAEGLQSIGGNIVLDDVALLHEREPRQARITERERAPDAPIDARTYNLGKLLVS